jgi:hypothetical protein
MACELCIKWNDFYAKIDKNAWVPKSKHNNHLLLGEFFILGLRKTFACIGYENFLSLLSLQQHCTHSGRLVYIKYGRFLEIRSSQIGLVTNFCFNFSNLVDTLYSNQKAHPSWESWTKEKQVWHNPFIEFQSYIILVP